MKLKIITPASILCLTVGLGLVGCGTTDDMNANNGANGYDYSTDGTTTQDSADTGMGGNSDRISGESLSNQINGIFGGYGTDGNNGTNNTNGNNSNGSSNTGRSGSKLGNNFSNTSNNSSNGFTNGNLGFQYGYGDGFDTSLNNNYSLGSNYNRNYTVGGNYNRSYTNNRFGFGMPGAENIIGNGSRASNSYSTDNLNNSLMS